LDAENFLCVLCKNSLKITMGMRIEKPGLLRQEGAYGMAQQECERHGLFRKLGWSTRQHLY